MGLFQGPLLEMRMAVRPGRSSRPSFHSLQAPGPAALCFLIGFAEPSLAVSNIMGSAALSMIHQLSTSARRKLLLLTGVRRSRRRRRASICVSVCVSVFASGYQ